MPKSIKILLLMSLVLMTIVLPLAMTTSAANDYEATLTIKTPSGVQTKNGTYLNMASQASSAMAAPTVKTEVTLKLNKDVIVTGTSGALTAKSNANGHLTFDLNGYDFTIQSLSFASNFINMETPGSITIDGRGDNGDISKIISNSRAGFIYNKSTNTNTVLSIKNCEFLYTNMSLGFCDTAAYPHQPMFNITAGDVTFENVKVMYTGTEATAVEGSTGGADISQLHPPFVQANGTADIKIDKCEFIDTNTKGIMTYGILAYTSTTTVTVSNSKIDAYNALYSVSTDKVSFNNCELRSTMAIFANSGKPKVTDCTIYVDDCMLSSGGALPEFKYGSGNNRIYAGSSEVKGSYTVEAGYQLCDTGDGNYIISDGKGYSTVAVSAIYKSGMVFQRGEPITVHGTCDTDGNTVEVTLAGVKKTAVVSGGVWSVTFDAMQAAKGLTLTIKEVEPEFAKEKQINNVDIGDVFILSGQSNMDYQAKYLEDYEEFLANANNFSNLRGFLVPNAYRHGEDHVGAGEWLDLTADNIGEFSAIGYVMATKLAAELGDDVTVAIVDATYPGSIAKTWIDIDTYKEHFGANHSDVSTYNAYLDFYKKNGRCPTSAQELSSWVGKSYQQVVASCYDSMIAFMQDYSAKAVVWYQGEGDLGRVSTYPALYSALTDSFRKTFGNSELPFVVIQLAPYSNAYTSAFRVMQQTLPNIDPYTYLVATSDEGAVYNHPEFVNNSSLSLIFVHTSRKSPIGLNTADVILDKIYNSDSSNKVLEVIGCEAVGNSVVITFSDNVTTSGVGTVLGFEIASATGSYVMANAVISGNTVTLTADGISYPQKVRYGYGSFFIEYRDGSIVIPVDGYGNQSSGSMTSTTLTFYDINGNLHTITKDANEVIRSFIPGNVTSMTGAPLYVFEMQVG